MFPGKQKGPRGASGEGRRECRGNKLKEVAGMLNAVSRVTITLLPPRESHVLIPETVTLFCYLLRGNEGGG